MFTTRNLLMLIGHHVLIALGWMIMSVLVVWFLSHEIKTIARASSQSHNLANALGKRADLLTTLKYDSEIVGEDDIAIEQAFPSSDNILGFIDVLEKMGTENSLTLGLHFGVPATTEINAGIPIAAIAYSADFIANIASTIDYLKKFEALPYFTKIGSLNISSPSKEGLAASSNVQLNATLYTKAIQ